MTSPLKGRKVLLVEDEALVAFLIEDMLVDLGCEVVASAAQLSRALEKAETVAADSRS
jgi:CheY-like chemotaxis protein